jgi:surface protein
MAFNPELFWRYGVGGGVFISSWKTDNLSLGSSTSTQIKLPLESTGRYNFVVDWGDGTTDNIITWNQAQVTHTYGAIGTYTVKIKGLILGWKFGVANTDVLKIMTVTKWGSLRFGNNGATFQGCQNVTMSGITDIPNLNGITTLADCFSFCNSISTIGRLNEWDMSKVTNLFGMFRTQGLSYNGAGVFNQNIGAWDVSKVTNFALMFRFCALFNNGGSPDIQYWNMSSAISLEAMFSRGNRFNQPIANWERTTPTVSTLANVTNMNNMFDSGRYEYAFNQPIGNWNVSKVTTMSAMFQRSVFAQDISDWDIRNVTNMTSFGIRLSGSGGTYIPFTSAQLDAMYNKWSLLSPLKTLVNLNFTQISTAAGAAGKAILTGATNNWIITEGTG